MPAAAKWLIVVLLAALPLLILVGVPLLNGPTPGQQEASHPDVIYFTKKLVSRTLRSPETAVFPADSQFRVQPVGPRSWRVSSFVDTESGLGSPVRKEWTLEVEKVGSRWTATKFELTPNEVTRAAREGSWTKRLTPQQ